MRPGNLDIKNIIKNQNNVLGINSPLIGGRNTPSSVRGGNEGPMTPLTVEGRAKNAKLMQKILSPV